MIGPKKKPQDFGFKKGDTHIIVNDISEIAKAFSFDGKLLWEVPALARQKATLPRQLHDQLHGHSRAVTQNCPT